uniref:Clp protease ATP binding subunit n=1 Tax=Neotessella volvocina TaxID=52559 RepID=A0A3G2QZW1_9STRA|nr:Clp protease ATP binding subunit [Neotessella volvocina]
MEQEEQDKGPALEIYGTDLTVLASVGGLDECFGREKELFELMEILVRRQKNNPVLVGDAGVGKTAIVELFASRIVENLVPFILEGRTLISLDLARIVAGSRYRGEFELRFQRVLDEVLEQPHIIIFIDEIHNLGGTGSAEGSLDAANILKPVLSRSGFQCIGATTTKEYQRIEKDPALNRRFQPIKVKEPSFDETVDILFGLRPSFESFHNVEISAGALRTAVDLSIRYINERFLPDKAIDLIDRAAAREVILLTSVSEGSALSALTNAGLNKIGALKAEAFRRGDIATEFVFQEIENSYRNFLFSWLESPLTIPEKADGILSPIGDGLFTTMRDSLLARVDELLFSSKNPRFITKQSQLTKNFSSTLCEDLYDYMRNELEYGRCAPFTISRASILTFGEWIFATTIFHPQDLESLIYLEENIENLLYELYIPEYFALSTYDKLFPTISLDTEMENLENEYSINYDIEIIQEKFEVLNELESIRIDIFKEYVESLQPLFRKGLVESLQYSSDLKFTEEELITIYTLLGFYSTMTGKNFLFETESAERIKIAKKLGDFSGLKKCIRELEVSNLLASITGIPIQKVTSIESTKLLNLEKTLHERVIGQEEAISAIAKAIRRSRLGMRNPNRPIASFFFCGPTGVGKTEVTKALAVSMFNSEADMIRFDMSEFMEKFAVSRLIGSPPGYVGYDDGGQLTDSVRKKPYSVVLFDEIEKAHPDVLNILLQILEDGRLTDSQKRLVPFDNTIIIMTSNAAAEEIQQILKEDREKSSTSTNEKNGISETKIIPDKKTGLSFPSIVPQNRTLTMLSNQQLEVETILDEYVGSMSFFSRKVEQNFEKDLNIERELENSFKVLDNVDFYQKELEKEKTNEESGKFVEKLRKDEKEKEQLNIKLKNAVVERLSTMFLPEFLNRLDDIIVFQPLRPEELRKICDLMINTIVKRVEERDVILQVDDSVREFLTKEGYNPAFGARPLRRLITKTIEDRVSENLLVTTDEIIKEKQIIRITIDNKDQVQLINQTIKNKEIKTSIEPIEVEFEKDFDFKKEKSIKLQSNMFYPQHPGDGYIFEITSESKKLVPINILDFKKFFTVFGSNFKLTYFENIVTNFGQNFFAAPKMSYSEDLVFIYESTNPKKIRKIVKKHKLQKPVNKIQVKIKKEYKNLYKFNFV